MADEVINSIRSWSQVLTLLRASGMSPANSYVYTIWRAVGFRKMFQILETESLCSIFLDLRHVILATLKVGTLKSPYGRTKNIFIVLIYS